ncbi:hypothetical protein DFA_11555 [Cavenderia fasciculata]|uniref:Pentatricopeptide repeat-containing protein n=1 Tax=Cavenderia fasciculata TaxID=261658 RepID=F4QDJ7_CACFS|nr:uncharacterized protein DFA_11555 [Cavenderia fasciculata]EGG13794.1 hypothetical protein DFA_11555 [Cavenderia fasciculata]|eukprot:XP_004350502.1 hypothetical protein DFA_11555 [Cavenderia fasciculata]
MLISGSSISNSRHVCNVLKYYLSAELLVPTSTTPPTTQKSASYYDTTTSSKYYQHHQQYTCTYNKYNINYNNNNNYTLLQPTHLNHHGGVLKYYCTVVKQQQQQDPIISKKVSPIRPISHTIYNDPVESIYDAMTKEEFEKHLSAKFMMSGFQPKLLLSTIQSDTMYQSPTILYMVWQWCDKLHSYKTIDIFNYILTFLRKNTIGKSGLFQEMANVLLREKYAPIVKIDTINIILGYYNDIEDHASVHRIVFMLTNYRKRLGFDNDTYIEFIRLWENDRTKLEQLRLKIENRPVQRSDVLNAHLIRAIILNGDYKAGMRIFGRLEDPPNAVVFDAILVSLASINQFDLFERYWKKMEEMGVEPLPQTIAVSIMKHGQFLGSDQFNQFYNLIQERYTHLVVHPEVLASFIHTLAYESHSYDYIEMFLNRLQEMDLCTPELCCNTLSIVVTYGYASVVEKCCNDIYNRIFKFAFDENLKKYINQHQQLQFDQPTIYNNNNNNQQQQNNSQNNQDPNIYSNRLNNNQNQNNIAMEIEPKVPIMVFERLIWASISLNNLDMVRKWWTAMMHQIWPLAIKPPKVIYSNLMRYYLTRGTKRELDTLIRTLLIFDMGVSLDQAMGQDQIPNTKKLIATGNEPYEQIADTIVYFEIYAEEQHRWGTQLCTSYVTQLEQLKTKHAIRQAYNRIIHNYLLIGRLEDAERWFSKLEQNHTPTASPYLWFIVYHTFRRQGRLAAEWEKKLKRSGAYNEGTSEVQRNKVYDYYRKHCNFSLSKPMTTALHSTPYFI